MRLSRLLNIVGILPLLALSADAQVLVTTPANAGPGSLRDAVATATVGDTILFAGPMTINLTSPIIVGVDGLVIEGCYPDVRLNASGLFPGIELNGVTGCNVRGLVMEGFNPALGFSAGANGNTVGGLNPCDRVEAHLGGMGVALSDPGTEQKVFLNVKVHQNLYDGIVLRNGASRNQFGDGSLAGTVNSHNNGMNGVALDGYSGAAVLENQFAGCLLGTDMTGMAGTGNTLSGVHLSGAGASDNFFFKCVISGNGTNGVTIDGGSSHTKLEACHVGVDISGVNALPNVVGVEIAAGSDNVIEGRCVISGNQQDGVVIRSGASFHNLVSDSLLGPDAMAGALGNGVAGVSILDGAWENKLAGNHISSNGDNGIFFAGNDPHHNTIFENLVGTDATGSVAMPNGRHGIFLETVATDNEFLKNVISGNTSYGVVVGYSSDRNSFRENTIGLDQSRVNSVRNNLSGMIIYGKETEVGGPSLNDGNWIAGNGAWGIILKGDVLSMALENSIQGNVIGLAGLGNGFGGVKVSEYTFDTSIGSVLGNSIIGNGGPGVLVGDAYYSGSPVDGIEILNNSISQNAAEGIKLDFLGNVMIPAPIVTAANSGFVNGYITVAATPCLVQVFRDVDDEGFEFLGEQWVTTPYGAFSIPASIAAGDRLTATQTAEIPGSTTPRPETSPFSSVMVAAALGSPGCFCTATVAPCGNADPTAGCANSTGLGATLAGHGSNSVSADDFTLSAERLPAGRWTMLLASKGSATLPFGDGLLCVNPGSRIWRLQVKNSRPWGAAVYGDGLVSRSLTLGPGAAIASGDIWYFQVLYRDLSGPCGRGRNLTNSVKIGFAP